MQGVCCLYLISVPGWRYMFFVSYELNTTSGAISSGLIGETTMHKKSNALNLQRR
jgi:hypothetical protein